MQFLQRFNIIQKFSFLSFLFVFTLSISAGFAISSYQKKFILEREGIVTADFVRAHVRTALTDEDFTASTSLSQSAKFNKVFEEIGKIPDIVNINVYNKKGTILWSPINELIGKNYEENNDFRRASNGEVVVTLEITRKLVAPHLKRFGSRFLEVYVPIFRKDSNYVVSVIGTYKTAEPLFENMRKGVATVWAVSLVSGLLLYMSLFWLFKRAYNTEVEIRRDIEVLNTELSNVNKDLESRVQERTRQVVHMEKLSAIGEMMGEIAHQLNNPLVGVVNHAQLAIRKAKKGVVPEKELETIEKASVECKEIIQRLLAFYRHSSFEPEETNINRLLDETLNLFKKQLSLKGIKVGTDYGKGLHTLLLDQSLIKQVFFNIINNARQAMPDGGELLVRTFSARDAGKDFVTVQFKDTGCGIKKGDMGKIFSPFFTTKARDEGTGLGLSIAHDVVVKHGGVIDVESEEGKGTSFYLKFPVVREGSAQ